MSCVLVGKTVMPLFSLVPEKHFNNFRLHNLKLRFKPYSLFEGNVAYTTSDCSFSFFMKNFINLNDNSLVDYAKVTFIIM